jgi:hypothetical protein
MIPTLHRAQLRLGVACHGLLGMFLWNVIGISLHTNRYP